MVDVAVVGHHKDDHGTLNMRVCYTRRFTIPKGVIPFLEETTNLDGKPEHCILFKFPSKTFRAEWQHEVRYFPASRTATVRSNGEIFDKDEQRLVKVDETDDYFDAIVSIENEGRP